MHGLLKQDGVFAKQLGLAATAYGQRPHAVLLQHHRVPARLLNHGQGIFVVVLQRPGVDFLKVDFVVQPGFFGELLEDAGGTTPDYGLAIGGFSARVGAGQAVIFIRHAGCVVGQHRRVLAVQKAIANKQNDVGCGPRLSHCRDCVA